MHRVERFLLIVVKTSLTADRMTCNPAFVWYVHRSIFRWSTGWL